MPATNVELARRAFAGDDVSITLAAVLKTEPDWRALPPAIPAGLRRLLLRCLKKDPKERSQAIGDARIEIRGTPVRGLFELRKQEKVAGESVGVPAGETLIFRLE